jgi:hypothetical protein
MTLDERDQPPEAGRWVRYVPGETVLEFNRWVISVGPRGARFMPAQHVADYGARFVFVVPRIPADV